MKDQSEIESLEKLIGQLQGLHSEISLLAKKSPNDAVNSFKLNHKLVLEKFFVSADCRMTNWC